MSKPAKTPDIIEKDGRRYQQKNIPTAIPLYAAALVWVVAALLVPLYALWHFLLLAALSIGVGILVKRLLPVQTELVELPFYEGNHDLDAAARRIADARDTFRQAKHVCRLSKPETAALLTEIEALSAQIQSALLASPADLPRLRRFINIYLPSTEKLAQKYTLLLTQAGTGANASESVRAIEDALPAVRDAYKAQLDAMFSDDALDISTDITVLETLLRRDNLR